MRERPSRLAGGAMGRFFASICGANLTSRAPRINKHANPSWNAEAPGYPGAAHESTKGTVRPLRLDPNLARVRFTARLD